MAATFQSVGSCIVSGRSGLHGAVKRVAPIGRPETLMTGTSFFGFRPSAMADYAAAAGGSPSGAVGADWLGLMHGEHVWRPKERQKRPEPLSAITGGQLSARRQQRLFAPGRPSEVLLRREDPFPRRELPKSPRSQRSPRSPGSPKSPRSPGSPRAGCTFPAPESSDLPVEGWQLLPAPEPGDLPMEDAERRRQEAAATKIQAIQRGKTERRSMAARHGADA